jgi:DNA-binding SARP family transcriptional activator
MAPLALTLLGGLSARRDGDVPVRLGRRKAAALLAYLACHGAQTHHRDKLAALLWPEAPEAGARHSLRQALLALRQVLPPGALHGDDGHVALDPAAVEVDILAFRRLVAAGTPSALAEAAVIYGGEFLAGVAFDEAPFDEWLQAERDRLREMAVESLARLLGMQRQANDVAGALQTALRLLALDPLQEAVHRTVMRLQVSQGRRDAALRQYQACADLLERELGVEPEADTKELYSQILRQRRERTPRGRQSPELEAPAPTPADAVRDVDPSTPAIPMVGREGEIQRLERALEESAEGRPRLSIVLGEAGIGKSRLLAELRSRAVTAGARVLLGRSYESAQIVPFGPWLDALRRGGAIEEPAITGLDPVWRRELTRLFPELGPQPGDVAEAPDDAGRLFEAVAQLLEHLAARQPVVVLLEDVHWADGMSVRLLASLARRSPTRGLMLVASARDDELSDAGLPQRVIGELAVERRLERLVLTALSRSETAELTQHLARRGSEPSQLTTLVDRMWVASHGHPFVIVETMTALEGSGDALAPGSPLPERVSEVTAARLARLTDRARTLVAVAAIIGREVEFALLRHAVELDEDEAASAVEELVRRHILRITDERVDFAHDHIRNAVLSQILPPRRRILHRQVAEALEAVDPDGPDRDWAALGTHCREARLWDKAAHYFREAGRTASTRSAEGEAAACFDEALAALRQAPQRAAVLEQTIDLYLELRNSLLVLADLSRARECLQAAESAARTLGDPSRAAWVSLFAGQLDWWTGQSSNASAFAERAATIAEAAGDRSLRITGCLYAGETWYHAGNYRHARRFLSNALLLAGEPVHGHQALPIPMMHAHLSRSLAELGEFAEGIRHGREALRFADAVGHRYSVMVGFRSLGDLYRIKGEYDEAIQLLERAVAVERERRRHSVAAVPLGHAYALVGRIAEGIALLEEHAAGMDAISWRLYKARLLEALGHATLIAGRLEDAQTYADEARALAHDRGERGVEAWALRLCGEIASVRHSEVEPAAERYAEALSLATERGMRPLMGHCHLGLAQLYRKVDVRVAEDHLIDAIRLYEESDMSLWLAQARSISI